MLYTSDGGSTWVGQVSGTSRNLYALAVLNPLNAWAVGSNGAILKNTSPAFIQAGAPLAPRQAPLSTNYPNPFNPSTVIAFDLLRGGTVSLKIYDLLGQEVATLVRDEKLEPGRHSLLFNGRNARGRDLPSGVYLYRLVVDGGKFIDVHKMLLLR
jgi:hypothetical protein